MQSVIGDTAPQAEQILTAQGFKVEAVITAGPGQPAGDRGNRVEPEPVG